MEEKDQKNLKQKEVVWSKEKYAHESDIPRNENGVRMKIIEFITFDIEMVSKKYTFSSSRREFSSSLSNC